MFESLEGGSVATRRLEAIAEVGNKYFCSFGTAEGSHNLNVNLFQLTHSHKQRAFNRIKTNKLCFLCEWISWKTPPRCIACVICEWHLTCLPCEDNRQSNRIKSNFMHTKAHPTIMLVWIEFFHWYLRYFSVREKFLGH